MSAANSPVDATRGSGRPLGAMVVLGLVGLLFGVIYLELLHLAFGVMWDTIPDALADRDVMLAGYILAMLTVGACLVGLLRRKEGVYGHSPLDGLKVTPDPARIALISLGAVVLTLLFGAVLGPEAGLLALGTAIGSWWASRTNSDDGRTKSLITAAVIGAVCGLVVSMGSHGTIVLPAPQVSVATDLIGSVVVAVAAALVAAFIRWGAYLLRSWADTAQIHVGRITTAGFAIGVVAAVALLITQVDAKYVLGSGEGYIAQIPSLAGVGTIAIIMVGKGLAYLFSLGGGLRGGPIFPAMFLGGLMAALLVEIGLAGDEPILIAAGVMASLAVGLALSWTALVITAVVIGLLMGSWLLIPATLIGLVIGRLVGMALDRVPGVGPVPDLA